MAQINLYDVVIPTFRKGLKTLDHILTKAEKFAQEKGLDADATFPGARLIDDQHPLTFQVQTSTKTVKTTLGRLTGVETEPFPDTETTLADLHKRVQAALDLLETADPAVVNARATTTIQVPFGKESLDFSVQEAALSQGIPNFFFHLNTAYSILRSKGVPVGKRDYIGSFLNLPLA